MKPHGLDALFEKLMPKSGKLFYKFLADAIAEKISIEESKKKLSSEEKDVPKDMFHYLYHLKDPETGVVAFAGEELHAEAFLMQSAGSDTTSTCLSSFFFYITRYPHAYKKITAEIRSAFQNVEEIRTGPKLTACQYLRASIDEAMRIGPPGTSDAPREVLPGGITVDGNFFPAGTDIGCPLYAMYHKESHYPDPNVFRPERWIVDENTGVTAEDVASAKAAFNPFQLGPGVCPGRALAINEQLIVVARTLFLMDVKLAPGDDLGAMKSEFGWGRSYKNKFDVKDAYISIRDGPRVQLRKRVI
jgi:cytochrome P450